MRILITIFVLCLFVSQVMDASPLGQFHRAYNKKEIKEQISEIRDKEYGEEFLKLYSEEDLEQVIQFLQDPMKHFSKILRILHIWPHVGVYQRYIREKNEQGGNIWGPFLETHFKSIDGKKLPILTFLFLTAPPGASKGLFADTYVDLFNSNPGVFIRDLRKRKDWKYIIDELLGGESSWKAGLDKLGNSKFEKEFKAYVSSRKLVS